MPDTAGMRWIISRRLAPGDAPGRGRGWRETMRRAAESAIAHDASHHAAFVLRVEGEPDGPSSFETARAALETLVGVGRETFGGTNTNANANANANAKALFRSAAFAAGAVAVDATLVDESGGTVSPATFVLATRKDVQNNTEETETTEETVFVFVWVPAAAREEAFRLCQKVTRSVLFSKRCSLRLAEGRLCRFEVAGALSSSLLETLSGNKDILNERDGGVTPRGVYSFETKLDAKSVADKRRNQKKETGAAPPGLDRSRLGGGSARARSRVEAATETRTAGKRHSLQEKTKNPPSCWLERGASDAKNRDTSAATAQKTEAAAGAQKPKRVSSDRGRSNRLGSCRP